ncbi:uncharacterized protein LOC143459370 isoform X2 [Clavelina lepadiformis]|uniref:uncharacterized protein LOC143459370 isoform X2 n=1 Tax=Clavelina lepadiformis TaxID=159417 RepID=UPI004041F7E7
MKFDAKVSEMAHKAMNATLSGDNNNNDVIASSKEVLVSSAKASSMTSSKSSNSVSSYSPVKTPTHFHHPEYFIEGNDNQKPRMVEHAKQVVVNVHPETGIDRTSIIENDLNNWQPSSPYSRCSWYSRWEDKEEAEEMDRQEKMKEERRRRNTEEIQKLPCSLGKMVLKEQERLEIELEKQGLDPRLTSRSPSANNPLNVHPRYRNPANASPSRIVTNSKQGIVTNSVQSLTIDRDNNIRPSVDNTLNTSVDGFENSTFIKVNSEAKLTKGVSMPAIPGQVKLFPYHILSTLNRRLPKGVDRTRLEQHLTFKEFNEIFGMTRDQFWRLPKWKRMEMKKKVHLF